MRIAAGVSIAFRFAFSVVTRKDTGQSIDMESTPMMTFPYVSAEKAVEDEKVILGAASRTAGPGATSTTTTGGCPVKHRTDALGGVKVQLYGVNSYGYLQYDDLFVRTKDGAAAVGGGGGKAPLVVLLPPLWLQDYLTWEEWNDFMTHTIDRIVKRHQVHGWMWNSGLGLAIVSFSTLMAIQEYGMAIFATVFFIMILSMSTQTSSPKSELKQACQQWSMERQRRQKQQQQQQKSRPSVATNDEKEDGAGHESLGALEVQFHVEESREGESSTTTRPFCPLRQGHSALGVLHFFPPKTMESSV
jgi:hypothetical protein